MVPCRRRDHCDRITNSRADFLCNASNVPSPRALESTDRRVWRRSRCTAPTGARFESPGRSALGSMKSPTAKPQRGEIPVGVSQSNTPTRQNLHRQPGAAAPQGHVLTRHKIEFEEPSTQGFALLALGYRISPRSGLLCSIEEQKPRTAL